MNSIRIAFVLLVIFSISEARNNKKEFFCRRYPYSVPCRGAWAKRDLQKLEPLLEGPRTPDRFNGDKICNDCNKKLLDTFFSKVNPRASEEIMDDYM